MTTAADRDGQETDGGGPDDRSAGEQLQNTAADVRDTAAAAKRSTPAHVVGRLGIASRAVIYLVLAVLTLRLAFGQQSGDADQAGAIRSIGATSAGVALLWLLALGMTAFILWRFSEAAFGVAHADKPRQARLEAGIAGACYIPFLVMAISVAVGNPAQAEQGAQYRSLSARVLQWPGGPVYLTIVGLVVIGVGVVLGSQGIRRSFKNQMIYDGRRSWQKPVTVLGTIGSTGRGGVFALAGVLVVVAALTSDPRKAGGIDSALRTLARQPYGTYLLVVSGAAFIAFGVFAVGEAFFRRL